MVKVEGLNFAYKKGAPIFRDFNWKIESGQRWAIIGPSGCGKSTLLYLLAGLKSPNTGSITIDHGQSPDKKTRIGLILQDYGLLPWATAFQNIALGLKIHRIDKKAINEIVLKWLHDLGLEGVATHFPAELSGGQRQRVAIARTLVLNPSLLLMDEPFASLDTLTREDLLDLTLSIWRKQPSTMVLVTHNIEEAVYWGSHILILHKSPDADYQTIENRESGNAGYRESLIFRKTCQQIREMIEQNKE